MKERKLVLQIVLGRREAVVLAALALLAFHPAALSTEQLTMTTYYPSPYGVYNQLRTTSNALLAYGPGASVVAVGTNSPPAGNKLHVQGTSRFTGNGQFDGGVGVGGAYTDVYATGVSLSNRNLHAQGNENGSWLRVGDAWGYNGIYSETGDAVVGSATGRVRIGPNDTQYIASACRMVPYAFGSTASCPSNWSVYSFGNGGGVMFNSPGGAAIGMPTSGEMLCCKLGS